MQHHRKLEVAGYVERIGSATTKKLQHWQLTDDGWKLVLDAIQRANGALSHLLNGRLG